MMILSAGDRVRIIKDAFENNEYDCVVIATRDSIAKVLSYDEYCESLKKEGAGASREYFSSIRKSMDEGKRYPILFVKVTIPPKEFFANQNEPVIMGCKTRRVCLLGVEFIEKI
jgi:hypothetical protein